MARPSVPPAQRCLAAVISVLTVAVVGAAPAWAIEPPQINRDAVPPDGPPAPESPNKQTYECRVGAVLPGTDFNAVNPAVSSLNLSDAWRYSRGAGQTVAVIDTGVRPHPRLPNLRPGGDYVVAGGDGHDDCDAHGTLIAGIIAAQPAPGDSFSGVAPDASILSIRQTSELYGPVEARTVNPDDPNTTPVAGDVRTLARAIVHAANMGATVINISGVSCISALKPIDQTSLGAAVWYAAVVKDVVIVAAAGNVTGECQQNPLHDAARPADQRDWGHVVTISTPSWFSDFILSVGALGQDGQPALSSQGGHPLTLAGPWVGAAAIGVNIVSLDPGGPGLINAMPAKHGGLEAINGTSFAAPAVAGLAALVRSRFPTLSAHQVIRRITETAHNPARGEDSLVGAGVIDPVAALTFVVAPGDRLPKYAWGKPAPAPVVAAPPDRRPMYAALMGLGAAAAVVGAAVGLSKLKRQS